MGSVYSNIQIVVVAACFPMVFVVDKNKIALMNRL